MKLNLSTGMNNWESIIVDNHEIEVIGKHLWSDWEVIIELDINNTNK